MFLILFPGVDRMVSDAWFSGQRCCRRQEQSFALLGTGFVAIQDRQGDRAILERGRGIGQEYRSNLAGGRFATEVFSIEALDLPGSTGCRVANAAHELLE
jgi:hypothetical protein